uniref:Uncharacterized protein n=1 Tax=Arion vulgaris TaxID=1028688 RepID=A0A0B7A114_9EUPU
MDPGREAKNCDTVSYKGDYGRGLPVCFHGPKGEKEYAGMWWNLLPHLIEKISQQIFTQIDISPKFSNEAIM